MGNNSAELIWTLARYDFKLRFNGSYLGLLWSLLKPAVIYLVMYIVFANIFKGQIEHFAVWLLIGFILWNFFSDSTTFGLLSLSYKSYLITKIYTQKRILILSSLVYTSLFFLIKLLILAILFIAEGIYPSFAGIIHFFIIISLMGILIVALSVFLSFFYLKYRDLIHIWEVVLNVGVYLTPVFYPVSVLPDWVQKIVYLNPMTHIVNLSKDALLLGKYPGIWQYLLLFISFSFFLVLSVFLSLKIKKRAIESI